MECELSDIILNSVGDVQRFITNAPTVLTNASGGNVRYRMYPASDKDLETLENSEAVTVPPGMVVEFFDLPLSSVTVPDPDVYEDANFEDVRDPLNTDYKYAGKMLWDVTTGAPIWASGDGAEDVWVDGAGSTVYTPVGVPDAFTSAMWTLTDLSTAGDANIGILEVPYDGNSELTDLEYRVDGGSWTSLGAAIVDDYPVAGFTDTDPTDVEIRAVNAIGNSEASDVKVVTTTV